MADEAMHRTQNAFHGRVLGRIVATVFFFRELSLGLRLG